MLLISVIKNRDKQTKSR